MNVHVVPTTSLGRAACWMALGFLAWFAGNQAIMVVVQSVEAPRAPIIAYGLAGLALGVATGIVALVALTRRRERALLVWLTTLPLLLVVAFLAGELLFPH